MSCLFTLVALCVMDPSQISLRADVSYQTSGDVYHRIDSRNYGGGHVGRVELDVPVLMGRHFSVNAFVLHQSLLDTRSDRGEERAGFQLVYRPFGGSR